MKVTISVQIVMLIFALVIILMLAPVDNINNKMNYEEKNYLKKKIRVILIIELFFICYFYCIIKNGLRINCSFVYCYSSGIAYIREYK